MTDVGNWIGLALQVLLGAAFIAVIVINAWPVLQDWCRRRKHP